MIRTSGRWDPTDHPKYFLAGNINTLEAAAPCVEDVLLAVNEITGEREQAIFRALATSRHNLFLDSGVFNLVNGHAVAHGMKMDEALSLAPDELDGFDALFARYVEIVSVWGDRLWGAVEIDAGGRENKIKTRARLEELGLKPIPVYHPFNDGWDYFDHLAENYDRICFGNVVQADTGTRKRLVATAWERRRKYPHLWIHLLGMTPSPMTVAFPMSSCDSSTWLSGARWGNQRAWAASQSLWEIGAGFTYDRKADSDGGRGVHTAWAFGGYNAGMLGRCMRRMADDQRRELGCDPTGWTIEGWPEPRVGR